MSTFSRTSVRGALIGAALATSLFSVVAAGSAAAASTGTTTANVGVSSGIALTGLTSSFTLSGAPGDVVSGPNAVAFNVQTNNVAGYAVTVQPTNDVLVPPANGNTDTIPIADLTVRSSGAGAYHPLSNSAPVTVHSQNTRSANGGDQLSNDYQITVPVVNADTYVATLNYVAATL